MEKTFLVNNAFERKYKIVDDGKGNSNFIIEFPKKQASTVKSEDYKSIIDYSQKNNKIVEIYDFSPCSISTNYYDNYFPMVIIEACSSLYDKSIIHERGDKYLEKFSSLDNVQKFYDSLVKELGDILKETGYCFTDVTGNNVLIDEDYNDFRIIDVFSIKKVKEFRIDPIDVFFPYNVGKVDGVLNKFLRVETLDCKTQKEFKGKKIKHSIKFPRKVYDHVSQLKPVTITI